MWVKICGINRLQDAVAAYRFGADAIGFIFADSPRRVTPDEAREISRRAPWGPSRVGVFVDSTLDEVRRTVEYCGLDLVQLHGHEDEEYCESVSRSIDTVKHRERRSAAPARRATETYFSSTSRERNAAGVDAAAFECQRIYGAGHLVGENVIKALRLNGDADLVHAGMYRGRTLLLDGYLSGGNGHEGEPYEQLVRLLEPGRTLIIAGGLDPGNVGEAISALRPYGVDVASGVESSPGVKDHALMYSFIERARKAEYEVNES
ncbi:MAG: phosphoribosylanthranilate isomerase [Actinobacteria bacterium]|nr:phosphoribosylanthranilate isomerase [Actinomycetota bacterium]MCG2795205.1 phosphoribosylanthranilate isomerase [Actinomycetes bacterium]MBU4241264.1 phosphoribosylanthranilate isomerase [Actinomycetota bacterium]MBU4302176.1 phosphoribosylanthranilate isomerase [Actinomycetota bacterium]MBU4385629.1 phosphoribosylanthranilate isomerase [Actinomycetota bacterium]